ncbi:MAG: MOSC domain-containing protein [Actinomycetota bacterium]|nr:MOSC domain-containing protein [Actinomycetota bacterium]
MSLHSVNARVEAVHVAAIETFTLPDGESHTSAIRKRAQAAPVRVESLGFVGDEQHDPAHGGPNRAVHVFSTEHYSVFEALAGRAIPAPVVGENLTLSGFPDEVAHVGDVVRVGTARLRVTMPTERCGYPGRNAGLPKLLKWMIEELRTGYYLSVLEPGEIGPGDAWVLEERTNDDWTIEALSRVMYREVGDAARVAELEAVPEIADEWKARLRRLHERGRS